LIIGGGVLGFVAAVFVLAGSTVRLSSTLDLGSILDAFAIILVGVLIDYVYYSLASFRKSDSELLLSLVEEAKRTLSILKAASQACGSKKLTKQEESQLVIAARELSNAIHSIQRGLEECAIRPGKLKFDEVKEIREILNDSLTGGPFPGPYTAADRRNIQIALRDMGDRLTRLGFAICHR